MNRYNQTVNSELLPRYTVVDRKKYTMIDFDGGFYQNKFSQQNLSKSELDPFRLRLVAFIELKADQDRYSIEFENSHAARYVSVMFTDRFFHEEMHDPAFGKNYDLQTIMFSGHKIPSLFRHPIS